MQNKIVERIWFEIKNLPQLFHGYDGMEGLKNEYKIDHTGDESYIKMSDALAIIERHLTPLTPDRAKRAAKSKPSASKRSKSGAAGKA